MKAAPVRTRRVIESVADKYRRILDMPSLEDREVEKIRQNVQVLARTICEHIWGKKFY